MKKEVGFLLILLVFSIVSVTALDNDLHLNIQTTNGTGHAIPGTYDFVFNISTSNNCTDYSSVVFSNTTTLTTDNRGVLSVYLYNVTADYSSQHYLCYFRNSTLKDTVKLSNVPSSQFAGKVNVSSVNVESNFNFAGYNFSVNTSNFFVDINSGRVGIGTSTPQNLFNVAGDANVTGTLYVNGENVTTNAQLLDGYNSSFFLPLNTSPAGTFDFNGGWGSDGLTISGGDLYAQTVFVYNITSLNVNNLEVNGSIIPQSPFDNLFDIGSSSVRYKDLFFAGNFYGNGSVYVDNNLTVDTSTLFVDSSGDRVGIGTSNPADLLHVNGIGSVDIQVESSSGSGGITITDEVNSYRWYSNDGDLILDDD